MATNEPLDDTGEVPPPPSTGAHLAYAGASRVVTTGNAAQVELYGNLQRPEVRYEGKIKSPLRFREAVSALPATGRSSTLSPAGHSPSGRRLRSSVVFSYPGHSSVIGPALAPEPHVPRPIFVCGSVPRMWSPPASFTSRRSSAQVARYFSRISLKRASYSCGAFWSCSRISSTAATYLARSSS